MDVYVAALVRLAHVDRIDLIEPVFLRERLADIVVEPVHALLHVGVFLDLPVLVVEVIPEHVDRRADERVDLARAAALFAIEDVGLRGAGVARLDEHLFHDVLDALDVGRLVGIAQLRQADDFVRQARRQRLIRAVDRLRGLPDGVLNLLFIERLGSSVALDDLSKHPCHPPLSIGAFHALCALIVYRIQDIVSISEFAYHILIKSVDMRWISSGKNSLATGKVL